MTSGINAQNVIAWLTKHVSRITAPIEFKLIAGGHSNLTYSCQDTTGYTVVLRRPPLGHVLESAHDMGREYKIISALESSPVPVPKTWGLCTEKEVNGAPFFVMDFVKGMVLHDSVVGACVLETNRRDLGLHVVHILCSLHQVDVNAVGLGDLGRKEGYLARQLKRWTKQWKAAKTHAIPSMEESCRILTERMPEQVGTAIVHGDYRLGNMIVQAKEVKAILDWELCTLGDPLADVGYVLNNWVTANELSSMGKGDLSPTAVGGYITRDEFTDIYESRTGRDLSNINYYRAFSHWRLAAIGQGVYKRYLVGAMGEHQDVNLDKQRLAVSNRADTSLELLTAG